MTHDHSIDWPVDAPKFQATDRGMTRGTSSAPRWPGSFNSLLAPIFLPSHLLAFFSSGRLIFLLAVLLVPGCAPPHGSDPRPLQSRLFSEIQIIGERGTALGQFNKPRSLALDPQDNLYVVDLSGRVQKFSPAGAFLLSWQMPETDLGKPKGMTRDAEGNIVVIEPHYSRINHFDPQGRLVAQWGSPGTNAGQFTVPRAVAIQTNGAILVCEYSKVDRVQSFHAQDKSFLVSFGKPGSGPGEFNRPEGLATDRQGRIYVADSCNHRIQVFSADGLWLASFGQPGTGPGQLSYPYDILADDAGRLYVCEFGNSRIQIFDARYQPLEIIGGFGFEPGRFHNPWSIALDSQGNLYVADGANHRVQKLVRRRATKDAKGLPWKHHFSQSHYHGKHGPHGMELSVAFSIPCFPCIPWSAPHGVAVMPSASSSFRLPFVCFVVKPSPEVRLW